MLLGKGGKESSEEHTKSAGPLGVTCKPVQELTQLDLTNLVSIRQSI